MPTNSVPISTIKHIPLTAAQKTKIAGIVVLAIVIHLMFWLLYRAILNTVAHEAFSSASIMPSLLTFVLFLTMMSFVVVICVLVENRLLARCVLLALALTYFTAFGISISSSVAVLLLVLAYWLYEWSIRGEIADRIKFSGAKAAKAGLGLTIMLVLLAIAISFNSVLSSNKQDVSTLDAFLNVTGDTANQLLALEVPRYDPNEPLDDFLFRIVAEQSKETIQEAAAQNSRTFAPSLGIIQPKNIVESLSGITTEELLGLVPQEVRAGIGANPEALAQYAQEQADSAFYDTFSAMRVQVVDKLGITADGTTPVGEVVRSIVKKNLMRKIEPYENFIPSLVALTIFITLQIFAFLYAWLIILCTGLLFWVLCVVKITSMQTASVEKQYPLISA